MLPTRQSRQITRTRNQRRFLMHLCSIPPPQYHFISPWLPTCTPTLSLRAANHPLYLLRYIRLLDHYSPAFKTPFRISNNESIPRKRNPDLIFLYYTLPCFRARLWLYTRRCDFDSGILSAMLYHIACCVFVAVIFSS